MKLFRTIMPKWMEKEGNAKVNENKHSKW